MERLSHEMQLTSSIPVDLLNNLTIDPEMSSVHTEIGSRALKIRDILSSFDRQVFPSEFKSEIFKDLDRPEASRPPVSEWTIQEDLQGTLLQWGSYNQQVYGFLCMLQSESVLARCFYEKLRRRFQALLEEYDELQDYNQHAFIRDSIQRIASGFRKVVMAVKEDRAYHHRGQTAVAQYLLKTMIDICRRHSDLVPSSQSPTHARRGTRRTAAPATDGAANLYEALIKTPNSDESTDVFMLDVLETFHPSTFVDLEADYNTLMSLLTTNAAPAAYLYRVGRLQSGSMTTSEPGRGQSQLRSTPGGEASVTNREPSESDVRPQTQAHRASSAHAESSSLSRTGSKRSAEDASSSTRRGKKKTTR